MNRATTILVVDDEPGIRRVLPRAFTLRGYRALAAATGEEAVEILKQHDVDAVLMDLRMPGMSGRTLYHLIASGWPHLATRLIVMSGDVEAEEHGSWLDATGVPVLSKPFELPDAVRLVERLLERRREANGL